MKAISTMLAALALAHVGSPAVALHADSRQPSLPLAGGWSETPVTPEVRAAAAFAASHLPHRHARLRSIDAARQQVVAGMNYDIDLTLTDRTSWRVRVWSKLDRTMQLTSAVRIARK